MRPTYDELVVTVESQRNEIKALEERIQCIERAEDEILEKFIGTSGSDRWQEGEGTQSGSFDLIAYPIDAKKKFMWDDKNRRAYEIQTSARKDSVLANADKKQKYNIPITWVTYDEGMLEEIKKITENKDEYLLTKV